MKDIIKKILKEETEVHKKIMNMINKQGIRFVINVLGGIKELKNIMQDYHFITDEVVQELIDYEVDVIREEAEEWGLGEMNELSQIDNLKKIEVLDVVKLKKIKVYIDVYSKTTFDSFDDLIDEIEYNVSHDLDTELEFEIVDIILPKTI